MEFTRKSDVLDHHGKPVEAKYDAATTRRTNEDRWSYADALSADQANSKAVREKLRNRARYEVANNSYARGIVDTLAQDTIGRGPRLQLLGVGEDVQSAWSRWADEVGLDEKLRTLRKARAVDGEGFLLISNDDDLDSEVKVFPRLIEADRVTSGGMDFELGENEVDGIILDDNGEPSKYRIASEHPGDGTVNPTYEPVDASQVIHLFKQDRAEQHRGIPELTAALPLFRQLRAYTLAVIDAAETAADLAAVLQTDAAPQDSANIKPLDNFEIERGTIMSLPFGWKIGQLKAEQPTTTYPQFKKEILQEIARCMGVPFGIAAGDSSDLNYSSGRLDHISYYKGITITQEEFETKVLSKILGQWLKEFGLMRGRTELPEHAWYWTGRTHADPETESKANEINLRNNATTLKDWYATQGKDWKKQLEQRAEEKQKIRELGLTEAEAQPQGTSDIEDEDGE